MPLFKGRIFGVLQPQWSHPKMIAFSFICRHVAIVSTSRTEYDEVVPVLKVV